jgi:hypothetical protein
MKQKKWFGLVPALALVIALLVPQAASAISEEDVKAVMNTMNDQLAAAGENFRLEVVSFITTEEAGQIVYFDDRTHQLGHHFVPADPRRGGYTPIVWMTEVNAEGQANGVTFTETQTAIANAMNTWDSEQCATIPLYEIPITAADNLGYVQWLLGFGPFPTYIPDVAQAGWLPGAYFDAIGGPGGSNYIIGVTWTFIWVDDITGEPTDIDGNGKLDTAFREVNYNNNFAWKVTDVSYPYIDVETVVLHETGHCLSIGHFGKAFRTESNWKLHFAPRAVMNAGYSGVQRELTGTDIASFCSIWAHWPNN